MGGVQPRSNSEAWPVINHQEGSPCPGTPKRTTEKPDKKWTFSSEAPGEGVHHGPHSRGTQRESTGGYATGESPVFLWGFHVLQRGVSWK